MVVRMQKIFIGLLTLIGILLLVLVLRRIGVSEILGAVQILKPWKIAVILSFPFLTFAIAAGRWKIILEAFGEHVGFGRLWRLVFAGAAISFVAPSFDLSGQASRALFITRGGIHGPIAFAAAAFDSLARALVNIATPLFLIGVAVVFLGFRGAPIVAIFLILSAILVLGIFLWLFVKQGGQVTRFLYRFVPTASRQELQEFDKFLVQFVREKRQAMWLAIFISFIGYLWEVMQVGIVLYFLGLPITILHMIAMHIAISLPKTLPTPGGLGFAETGGAFGSVVIGSSPILGLTVAVILRARDLSGLLIGLLAFLKERYNKSNAGFNQKTIL